MPATVKKQSASVMVTDIAEYTAQMSKDKTVEISLI